MAVSEVYKSKFPPTKQLDACYSDVVPEKSAQQKNLQLLESTLIENSLGILINAHHTHTYCCICLESKFTASSNCHSFTPSHPQQAILSERINELREELANQITALKRSIHTQEDHLTRVLPTIQTLIKVSRESPSIAACVLGNHIHATPTLVGITRHGQINCAGTKADTCMERALPFSRFCLKRMSHMTNISRFYVVWHMNCYITHNSRHHS